MRLMRHCRRRAGSVRILTGKPSHCNISNFNPFASAVGRSSKYDDSYIRIMAIQYKIPYITSLTAAEASVEGIESVKKSKGLPKSLQDYYKELK